MRIDNAQMHALRIPFRIGFTHSKAKRLESDSLILEVSAGGHRGFGEAVVRDYVSGSFGDGGLLQNAARVASEMLATFRSTELTLDNMLAWSETIDPPDTQLPILCAVETALLDLLCSASNTDVYTLLGREPVRDTLIYGGTVPMLPPEGARQLIQRYAQLEISNLRLKIGKDVAYNRMLVELARSELGKDFDLRVDANGAWEVEEALENLPMLGEYGITVIEEPFGRDEEKLLRCLGDKRSERFVFVADESILSTVDLEKIINTRTYSMINVRLSKNGGLLRSLKIDEVAHSNGIRDQLGCHVGETGILSAAGRVAASLMKEPVYVDGSYDGYLLSQNITTKNLSFGRGGYAGIIRDKGLGFIVDTSAVERLTYDHATCV